MSTRCPVSVFVIARDEADRIPLTLASVSDWVDEMIVVDSGSSDDTVGVSERLGARVVHHDWQGYGPQKVFAEGLCRNDWVLNLDADEQLSPELAAEIRALFVDGGPSLPAYRLPILPLYVFQSQGHPRTAHHRPIRLYRRSRAGFKDARVHDTVVLREGRAGRLRGMVVHRSFRSLAHHVEKVNGYSSAQAEDLYEKRRNPGALSLLFTPPLAFLKQLLLRHEWVNGIDGVIVSYMYAFQRFIRLAKARERFLLASRRRDERN